MEEDWVHLEMEGLDRFGVSDHSLWLFLDLSKTFNLTLHLPKGTSSKPRAAPSMTSLVFSPGAAT